MKWFVFIFCLSFSGFASSQAIVLNPKKKYTSQQYDSVRKARALKRIKIMDEHHKNAFLEDAKKEDRKNKKWEEILRERRLFSFSFAPTTLLFDRYSDTKNQFLTSLSVDYAFNKYLGIQLPVYLRHDFNYKSFGAGIRLTPQSRKDVYISVIPTFLMSYEKIKSFYYTPNQFTEQQSGILVLYNYFLNSVITVRAGNNISISLYSGPLLTQTHKVKFPHKTLEQEYDIPNQPVVNMYTLMGIQFSYHFLKPRL